MPWPTDGELDDLVSRFGACTLPKAEWTHQAHLAVGTWYVHQHGAEQALRLLCVGIVRLNETHGTINDDAGGYHETITAAYVHLVAAFVTAHPGLPAALCVQAILDGPLAAKPALFRYYAAETLMSVAARRGWVEPDIAPFRLPGAS